jgi:hypothetical protein
MSPDFGFASSWLVGSRGGELAVLFFWRLCWLNAKARLLAGPFWFASSSILSSGIKLMGKYYLAYFE